jgi:hypothetical protein
MKQWGKSQQVEKRGIPQGSPISDIIANMYMLDFDIKMKELADQIRGYYRRYSDDILLVIPEEITEHNSIITQIKTAIEAEGSYLRIKDSKTIITRFFNINGDIKYESIDAKGNKKGNAFEYLGFGFDGEKILIKSQTLTRYYKKMHHGIYVIVKKAMGKAVMAGENDPMPFIDVSGIYHRYSNPNRNWKNRDGRKARNFIGYVKRSIKIMSDDSIQEQLRSHRKIIRKTLKKAIIFQQKNHN